MFKAALVGAWHVHFDQYATEFSGRADCEITALWDDDAARGKECAARYHCDFEPDYDALLRREDVQGVIVCSATNLHPELLIKAANAGKHIYTEKVLAFTYADALKIKEAVERSGIKFCISFPWRCRPDMLFAKQTIDSGALGQITYVRMRNCHNGASAGWLPPHFYDPVACGGGAMMDLGAHPMYLLDYFLGLPESITSVFTSVTGKPVEDNAVSVFAYADGTIACSETGFVAEQDPFALEICGTKGTLFLGGYTDRPAMNTGNGWETPVLPEALPKPMDLWVDGVLSGTPIPFGIDEAVRLTQLMETAYASSRTGAAAQLVR